MNAVSINWIHYNIFGLLRENMNNKINKESPGWKTHRHAPDSNGATLMLLGFAKYNRFANLKKRATRRIKWIVRILSSFRQRSRTNWDWDWETVCQSILNDNYKEG